MQFCRRAILILLLMLGIQHVSSKYRKEYFDGIMHQKTSFFDQEENSIGSLTARVGSDPKQLEELLGMNMAMVYNSCVPLHSSSLMLHY